MNEPSKTWTVALLAIQKLAAFLLKDDYLFIAVGQVGAANSDVTQTILNVSDTEKISKIKEILNNQIRNKKTIVFVEMKKKADFLAARLCQDDFRATSIHGDREQREREQALRDFKGNKATILVATAVAARGLDIPSVDYVINFDMPSEIDEFVHRVGRTGRVGMSGQAITFLDTGKDSAIIPDLVKTLKDVGQEIPDWLASQAQGGGMFGGDDFSRTDIRETTGWAPSGDDYKW